MRKQTDQSPTFLTYDGREIPLAPESIISVPSPRPWKLEDKKFSTYRNMSAEPPITGAHYRLWRVPAEKVSWCQPAKVSDCYGYFKGLSGGKKATRPMPIRHNLWDLAVQKVLTWKDECPELTEWELSNYKKKVGPQGHIASLDNPITLDLLLRYGEPKGYQGIPAVVWDKLKSIFAQQHLTPLTLDDVLARNREKGKGNTSEGFPGLRKRKACIDETRAYAENKKSRTFPARRGARAIRCGHNPDEYKGYRNVFGTPASHNLEVARFALAIEAMLTRVFKEALVGETGFDNLVAMVHHYMPKAAWIMSTDFSKMDTLVGYQLRLAITRLLSYAFDKPYREEFIETIMHGWDMPTVVGMLKNSVQPTGGVVRKRIADPCHPNQELVAPVNATDAEMRKGYDFLLLQEEDQGLSSGDRITHTWENVASIICHLIMIMVYQVQCVQTFMCGDDGLMLGKNPEQVSIAPVAYQDGCSCLGLIANAEKQFMSGTTGKYLQRFFSKEETNCKGAYSFMLGLNGIINPERSPTLTEGGGPLSKHERERIQHVLRQIMIMENWKYHPYFESMVDFVVDFVSPQRCGLAIEGFFSEGFEEVLRAEERYIRDHEELPQSARSSGGIRSFAVFKYLAHRAAEETKVRRFGELAIRGLYEMVNLEARQ